MTDDIVLNKKESIERCIAQIRDYYARPSVEPFEQDYLKQDAIAANLQRAAELCIDMANRIIKRRKLGIPKESKDSFEILEKSGLISPDLSQLLQGMVGFRNVLVHEYQKMDIRIMRDVVENRLDDLAAFTTQMMELG
ncbi:DUF86 domain-containing protein [Candidatus Sumerlaeota bacterium]|nr:DUF86 domain-containing protein [Candidatus Sumerlaeota bacterium]